MTEEIYQINMFPVFVDSKLMFINYFNNIQLCHTRTFQYFVTTLLLKHTDTQMTPTQMNSGVMAKAAKSTCLHKTRYCDGKYESIKKNGN